MSTATATNGDTTHASGVEPITGPAELSAALLSMDRIISDTTVGGHRHLFLEAVRLLALHLPASERAAAAELLRRIATTTGVTPDQILSTVQFAQRLVPGAQRK